MPQSLSQVILHIVFGTQERRPWLDPETRPRLHAYLATGCRDGDCQAYRVGGQPRMSRAFSAPDDFGGH
jgi:putative transposase